MGSMTKSFASPSDMPLVRIPQATDSASVTVYDLGQGRLPVPRSRSELTLSRRRLYLVGKNPTGQQGMGTSTGSGQSLAGDKARFVLVVAWTKITLKSTSMTRTCYGSYIEMSCSSI